MPELKMLQVEQEIHELTKKMAKAKGVSIKAYVRELVEKDQRDEHEKKTMGRVQS